jgi:outer membrane lipoprotein-sorting protein
VALALLCIPLCSFAQADEILARTRAAYAALSSYEDTGTVDLEFGPAGNVGRERHTFTTSYRAPRHFYFDFTKYQKFDRYVVWSDEQSFHSWWQTTGVETAYPKGQGSTAIVIAASPTQNSIAQITPLLFPKAGLTGTLTEFGDVTIAGQESVDGRTCHKLTGIARSVYGTKHVVNVRKTTVWIDAESFLVRRIVEDPPEGAPVGAGMRVTTTFHPKANPPLEDRRFVFTVPAPLK